MTQRPVRLDTVYMVHATDTAEYYTADIIKRATMLQTDSDKVNRLRAGLCRYCHYAGSRIGCASMTDQPCAACGVVLHYGSTATDALCLPCATEHKLCKRCGGDSEMRPLRRKWPTFNLAPRT